MRKIPIAVLLDQETQQALDQAAREERRSKSEIIRKALENYLKSREGK